MPWSAPDFSKNSVDAAGRVLTEAQFLDENSARIIGNWRAGHAYPLFALHINLRSWANKLSSDALVSQRLKRLSSIALKLRLHPNMKLSKMQDIGGCRAIVQDVVQVEDIVNSLRSSRAAHELVRQDDFISEPKSTGYRGYHLVYKYRNNNRAEYNNLKIEMQVRSRLQHAWATAVETAGTFQGQALKSNLGSEAWLRFFQLVASDIARREKRPLVPGTPVTARALRAEIRSFDKQLGAISHLRGWQMSLKHAENVTSRRAHYFLLQLFPDENRVNIIGFAKEHLDEANAAYLAMEESAISTGKLSDSVLVSVESIKSLRRAYPNYFSDTEFFIDAVQRAKG